MSVIVNLIVLGRCPGCDGRVFTHQPNWAHYGPDQVPDAFWHLDCTVDAPDFRSRWLDTSGRSQGGA